MTNQKNVALFIDADNAPATEFEEILPKLDQLGRIIIRRAFGNWRSSQLNPWANVALKHHIQPCQQFNLTTGKNAADIAMTISIMDTIHTKDIGTLVLVSSDCDFTPLVLRILEEGIDVIGIGERKAPKPFVDSCSQFLFLDNQNTDYSLFFNEGNQVTYKELINALILAIKASKRADGWAELGPVGSHISAHSSVNYKDFGFKKLSELFKDNDFFEINTEGSSLLVRSKHQTTEQ